MRTRPIQLAPISMILAICAASAFGGESPSVSLEASADSNTAIVARGVDSEAKATLEVFVASDESGDAQRLPLLGELRREKDRLIFLPRFPLAPGRRYDVVLRVSSDGKETQSSTRLSLPKTESPPTVVDRIDPSDDVLPENQLKFYLHFSAPMSRGQAYEHIRLLNARGEQVDRPFLELTEELWDRSGKRLTLFFDPGRIKRGLRPREDLGPTLEAGGEYSLVVDAAWSDAQGLPLAESYRKHFTVADPDDVQPKIESWRIEAPRAGGRAPLVVAFDEPLDRAMLERVIEVARADGEAIDGEVTVGAHERSWSFTPKEGWIEGEYKLVVDAALEDRAGNSLAKPFEIDVFRQVDRERQAKYLEAPFRVTP